MGCEDYNYTNNILGGGATFYIDKFYAGGAMAMQIYANDDNNGYKASATYLELHGGYLHNLTQNVYLDVGFSQLSGMGEYKYETDDGNCGDSSYPDCSDNESSTFQINVGIKSFFNLPDDLLWGDPSSVAVRP